MCIIIAGASGAEKVKVANKTLPLKHGKGICTATSAMLEGRDLSGKS